MTKGGRTDLFFQYASPAADKPRAAVAGRQASCSWMKATISG